MSDIINRADIAACACDGMFRDIFNREERHDIIRVIIEEMRQPTTEMTQVGAAQIYSPFCQEDVNAIEIWRAMIDEALK